MNISLEVRDGILIFLEKMRTLTDNGRSPPPARVNDCSAVLNPNQLRFLG